MQNPLITKNSITPVKPLQNIDVNRNPAISPGSGVVYSNSKGAGYLDSA
jgi:hypothetical protein